MTRLWLGLYRQMRRAEEMLTRSKRPPHTTLQPLFKQVAGKCLKAFSQSTAPLCSHCTPTRDHYTPSERDIFLPGGPHLLSSLTASSFNKTAAPSLSCQLRLRLPHALTSSTFFSVLFLIRISRQLRQEVYITPAHSDHFHLLNEFRGWRLRQRALSAL